MAKLCSECQRRKLLIDGLCDDCRQRKDLKDYYDLFDKRYGGKTAVDASNLKPASESKGRRHAQPKPLTQESINKPKERRI